MRFTSTIQKGFPPATDSTYTGRIVPEVNSVLLNRSPVTRARSSGELQSRLGSRYREVMEFFEAESAGELWLFLQSRSS
jgi:hypothetical protein